MTFLNTGYIIFCNLFGSIISTPGFWFEIDPLNITATLWDLNLRTDIDFQYYQNYLFPATTNNNSLRPIKILNQYYVATDYYESKVLLPYNFIETTVLISYFGSNKTNILLFLFHPIQHPKYKKWEFAIILHVQKAEIDSIQEETSQSIQRHSRIVLTVGLLCCCFTTAFVIVCCFSVAMSISKPLKNVIRVANFINDNAGRKEVISQIISDVGGIPEV